jgi:nucleoid-associated protein YgaU
MAMSQDRDQADQMAAAQRAAEEAKKAREEAELRARAQQLEQEARQRLEEAKARIRARGTTPPQETPPGPPPARMYEVQAGDTLAKIAKQFYGDANRWHEIHEANRDSIPNPNLIQVGQKIRIP